MTNDKPFFRKSICYSLNLPCVPAFNVSNQFRRQMRLFETHFELGPNDSMHPTTPLKLPVLRSCSAVGIFFVPSRVFIKVSCNPRYPHSHSIVSLMFRTHLSVLDSSAACFSSSPVFKLPLLDAQTNQLSDWTTITYQQFRDDVERSSAYWAKELRRDAIPQRSVIGLWYTVHIVVF